MFGLSVSGQSEVSLCDKLSQDVTRFSFFLGGLLSQKSLLAAA